MQKPKLKTVSIVLGLFFILLLFSFPFDHLKGYIFGQIYNQTRILIVADDIYPSFFGWPGIGIKNVNVTLPVGDGELELASEKLIFRVGLGGLFPPVASASMNLKNLKKGGDLYVKFGKSSSKMFASLNADEVNLEQLAFSGLNEPIQGILNSDAKVTIDEADLSKSSGKVELTGINLKTPAHMVEAPGLSFLIPGMKVGKLDAVITIHNGALEFTTFKFGTPQSDLSGSIAGDIKLGQDIMRSTIHITLRLQLASRILQDPQAQTFVAFLSSYQSKTPGDYSMSWNASIQELAGLSIKILPTKAPE